MINNCNMGAGLSYPHDRACCINIMYQYDITNDHTSNYIYGDI